MLAQLAGPRACNSGWPFGGGWNAGDSAKAAEEREAERPDLQEHHEHLGLAAAFLERLEGHHTARIDRGRISHDAAHLVASMTRMLGPWLQAHIEHHISAAVEKAAKALIASRMQAPTPTVTIDAIGRRIDEAMRIAVSKAAVSPHPSLMSPSRAFDGLIATPEQPAKKESPKSCIKDASSPKTAHIALEGGVIQIMAGEALGSSSPTGERPTASRDRKPPRCDRQASLRTFMSKRCESRCTLGSLGGTSLWTGTTYGAQSQEEGNKKALYVNFRRLIEIKEKLDIVHEVIKATTIALLTLLAVSNGFRLAYDLGFLVCGIALYAQHEISHDALDIDDYKRVVGLLGNDGDDILRESIYIGGLDNPNRCIQALSFSRHGRHKLLSALLLFFFVVVCATSWGLVWNVWMAECNWYCMLGWSTPGELWDIEHYVTLLVVGTLMLLCHFSYEALYYREFKYIMPSKDLGNGLSRPWDLDQDGIPRGHLNWLFGLPCVWFSTREAYEELRIWVTLSSGIPTGGVVDAAKREKARHQHTVRTVFFEEMAVYALEDCDCAARLRRSLLASKLYDKQLKRFLRRLNAGEAEPRGQATVTMTNLHSTCADGRQTFLPVDVNDDTHVPEELGIELLFYDNRSGEVWVPNIPMEPDTDAPMRLKHEASLRKVNAAFSEL